MSIVTASEKRIARVHGEVIQLLSELAWHVGMDNERNSRRFMDKIWEYHKSYSWLPFLTWEINQVDVFIKEECSPSALPIVLSWQAKLETIDIQDPEVMDRIIEW